MNVESKISKSVITDTQIELQHNELRDRIASINNAIHNHLPHEQLVNLALQTQQNLETHFATEEALMVDIKYPKSRFLQHKASHLEALHQLSNLASYLSLNNIPSKKVFEFLFDWSYVHELNEDKELFMFLKKSRMSL